MKENACPATLLIADDERGVVEVMQRYFTALGYRVVPACSGGEALEKLRCRPDLILLDVAMPDLDGLTLCRRIRAHVACPILFLSARVETADRIGGLRAGADDYITKPFSLEELAARVEAHLRREGRRAGQTAEARFFGELAVEYLGRSVSIGGEAVPLSKKEFDIVELLSQNAGQVFDRERIYELVWGLEGSGSSDTVMEHIRKIRAKFAAKTAHSYIETVWGVGYKWNG